MENNPLFSILIASYNNASYISQAIESVFSQTYINFEIVIVDDASTDDSKAVIQSFITNKKVRIYYNEKNYGCGFTKRRLAELANGNICGFLDSDDTLMPNALQIMVDEHIKYATHSLIYSNHFVCDQNLGNPIKSNYTGKIEEGFSFLIQREEKNVSHFASFKKNNYNATEGIDATLQKAVDHDMFYKLEETGLIKYIDACLYNYRIHAKGISTGNNAVPALIQHYKVRINAIKKRKNKQEVFKLYPKDKLFINYQYFRCNFYLNRLLGNKLKTFNFLNALLLRWPLTFRQDVFKKKII